MKYLLLLTSLLFLAPHCYGLRLRAPSSTACDTVVPILKNTLQDSLNVLDSQEKKDKHLNTISEFLISQPDVIIAYPEKAFKILSIKPLLYSPSLSFMQTTLQKAKQILEEQGKEGLYTYFQCLRSALEPFIQELRENK
jgi:hypothetical protein